MNAIGSWEWRTTPPLTITRAIVGIVVARRVPLYVFLVNGRVELRDEVAVEDVDSWLCTVGPRSVPAQILTLLMEGVAMDAKERPRVTKHTDGPLYLRITNLLRAKGPLLADEIARALNEPTTNVRSNLTTLRDQGVVYLTDIRVQTPGTPTGKPGIARKYDIVRQAEAA